MIAALFNSIKSIYKNTSYQNKLIISFYIIILLPIILLSSFSYYQNIQMVKTQSVAISELYLNQVQSSIDAKLNELANTAKFLSRHNTIIRILEKDPSSISISEQIEDLRELDLIVSGFLSSPTIYNIRLYVKDGFIYSNRNAITYNINNIANLDWAKMLNAFYSVIYFTEPYEFSYVLNNTQRIISAVVPIRNSNNFEDIIAVICVDMLEKDLLDLMAVADYTSKGQILITDINYKPLSIYTTTDKPYLDFLNGIIDENNNPASKSVSIVDNNVVGVTSLWNTWKLISISSIEDMLTAHSYLRLQFILLVIIATIGVYFIAYIYGKHNAKRINTLAKQIRVVESGNFNVKCVVDSADEIGELQTSFNYMVKKINSLMQEQYNLGRNLNAMELRVLQAQINPHFLYNTLDLILWAARRGNMAQVCDIVIKLSKFYRISLSNGNDYISLSDEIEHVRLYTELQNLRFAKKINLYVDIDKRLENYKIMKLLLQPIVENSILHGIANSDLEQGEIRISAALEEDMIRISVADNGIGMDQDILSKIMYYEEILYNKEHTSARGYGLRNVINRLKLYYSDKASIAFDSAPNAGTKVTITIPMDKDVTWLTEP